MEDRFGLLVRTIVPAQGSALKGVEEGRMLAPLGGALIVSGLYWLVLTVARRITSDEEYRASEQREAEIKERGGFGGGQLAGPERISRLAYDHPALVRRPAQICVAVGVILIVVDVLH